MAEFIDFLGDPWTLEFMRRGLIAAVAVSAIAAVIGSFVILKGMAFIGDALPHASFGGIAVAFVLGGNLYLGGAIAAVLTAILIGFISRRASIKYDTAIGILFVGAFAAGILIISRQTNFTPDLFSFVFDALPGIHPTNILVPGEVESTESMARLIGDGVYIGRIWYTYPVNGLRAGDFTGTVVGDSYVIREGKLAEPIKPNTLRINENIRHVLNGVIGVSKEGKPTLVWAADEIVYAPEMAVEKVRLDAIGEFMETL